MDASTAKDANSQQAFLRSNVAKEFQDGEEAGQEEGKVGR